MAGFGADADRFNGPGAFVRLAQLQCGFSILVLFRGLHDGHDDLLSVSGLFPSIFDSAFRHELGTLGLGVVRIVRCLGRDDPFV